MCGTVLCVCVCVLLACICANIGAVKRARYETHSHSNSTNVCIDSPPGNIYDDARRRTIQLMHGARNYRRAVMTYTHTHGARGRSVSMRIVTQLISTAAVNAM